MEENKGRSTRILEWDELIKKSRSPKEELLMQSVYRLEPAYWVGVKLLEDSLYGAFCFHRGTDVKRRVASAAFLLDEQAFLLVIIKDENDLLHHLTEIPADAAEMQDRLESVFEGILKHAKQKVEDMEK